MFIVDIITVILLLFGALFTLASGVGILALPNSMARLHASSTTSTLGLGCFLLAGIVHGVATGYLSIAEIVIAFLVFITAPVSSLFMAQAILALENKE